jgi:hypothetical protein
VGVCRKIVEVRQRSTHRGLVAAVAALPAVRAAFGRWRPVRASLYTANSLWGIDVNDGGLRCGGRRQDDRRSPPAGSGRKSSEFRRSVPPTHGESPSRIV